MPMKIDLDVAAKAKFFGIDPKLIQAVVNAEGDILKAVRISVPTCKDRAQAIEITCRSACHRMSDFIYYDGIGTNPDQLMDQRFVEFWRDKWAPLGAKNDPKNLNKNWARNVLKLWRSA